jgi:hypothetical protein
LGGQYERADTEQGGGLSLADRAALSCKRPRCIGAALVSLALVSCSPTSVVHPPVNSPGTPSTTSTPSTAPAAVAPSGPEGAVQRAYAALERGDVEDFLNATDPAIRSTPGPLTFGNLVVRDVAGLQSDLSKLTFSEMHYAVISTEGEWAQVVVRGVVRSAAPGSETVIDGVEITHKIQDRWVLSTAPAATAAVTMAPPLESPGEQSGAVQEDVSTAAATPPEPDPPYWHVVGDDGANLREAPSLSAGIVRELADGQVVTNLDEVAVADELDWRKVADGPVEGWVAAELLAPQLD